MPWEAQSPLGSALGFVGEFMKARQDKAASDADLKRQASQQAFENAQRVKQTSLQERGLVDAEAKTSRANKLEDRSTGVTQANQMLRNRLVQATAGLQAAAQQAVAQGKYDPGTFAKAVGHVAYTLTQRIKAEHPGVLDSDLDVLGAIGSVVDPVTARDSANKKAAEPFALERMRSQDRMAEKGVPTYANLHPRSGTGRGRGGGAAEDDVVNYYVPKIAKSSDPKTTAEGAALQAEASGANPKTAARIRAYGAYYAGKYRDAHPKPKYNPYALPPGQ